MSRLKINERLIIRCYDHEQVQDVLNKLSGLGYTTEFNETSGNTVCYNDDNECFFNVHIAALQSDSIVIWYKRFLKIFEKQKEKLKKEPDLIIDKNEKILKVNNENKDHDVFYYDTNIEKINEVFRKGLYLAEAIKNTDFYTSFKACEKALKRKEIENKLRLLAFKLNGNRDISKEEWKDYKIEKYYLYFNEYETTIKYGVNDIRKNQGSIYCLSQDFRNKAIELIGEENLKDYLINC